MRREEGIGGVQIPGTLRAKQNARRTRTQQVLIKETFPSLHLTHMKQNEERKRGEDSLHGVGALALAARCLRNSIDAGAQQAFHVLHILYTMWNKNKMRRERREEGAGGPLRVARTQ